MLKIEIDQKIYKGIPYNEYYGKLGHFKGLVFIQHGFESNKNRGADYLGIELARLGFYAVAIDAYKHGLRIEEPFISKPDFMKFEIAFDVITRTADDILILYNDLFKNSFREFDIIGVSMGGMIAYNCALKTEYINRLIPVISTPYLYEFSKWLIEQETNQEYANSLERIKDYIQSIDPYYKTTDLRYNKLYILNTSKDTTVPAYFSEEFVEKNKNEKIQYKLYNATHTVTREMKEDILSYIAEEKVVL